MSTNDATGRVFTRQGRCQNDGRRWQRIARDRYTDDEEITDAHRWRAALAGCPEGTAISHVSAVRAWDLPMPWRWQNDQTIHVSVPSPAFPPQRRGITGHQAQFIAGDVVDRSGVMVTSPERTFLDVAAALSPEQLVAFGDAMLRSRLTSRESLAHRIELAVRRRGIFLARLVLPALDERAQSIPESVLRVRLSNADLPPVTPQCPIRLDARRTVHVDLGYPDFKVAIEHDGRHHYENIQQFEYDNTRYTDISAAGWLLIKSTGKDLATRSTLLITKVRRALITRGWRGKS